MAGTKHVWKTGLTKMYEQSGLTKLAEKYGLNKNVWKIWSNKNVWIIWSNKRSWGKFIFLFCLGSRAGVIESCYAHFGMLLISLRDYVGISLGPTSVFYHAWKSWLWERVIIFSVGCHVPSAVLAPRLAWQCNCISAWQCNSSNFRNGLGIRDPREPELFR